MKNEANIVFIEMVRKATQKKRRLSETNFKVKYLKQSKKKETSTVSKVITKTNNNNKKY